MPCDKQYPTSRSPGDYVHVLAKAGLSIVPLIGGPTAELLQFVIAPPLEKRRVAWVNSLEERLLELEANGIKLENLKENEQFISAVLQVTQSALRTHQAEKLDALRNAIVNVARGQTLDDTLLYILLSHIDTLSEMHLRVLKVCQVPRFPVQWEGDGMMHHIGELLFYNIPELQGSDIQQQLLIDLNDRGLIAIDLMMGMQLEWLSQQHTTPLGERLIRLITV